MLGTLDAHALYEQVGFGPLERPELMMERLSDEPASLTAYMGSSTGGRSVPPDRYPRFVSETVPQTVIADRRRADRSSVVVRHAHAGAYVGGNLQRREWREAELDVLLAPGATRPVGAGDRRRPEEPDPFRLCFERDLDRVKHSRPWRRLAGKCQVFIAPEDDHLRTRLTHAVEVAQVATGIARATGLCVPLTEAIALAHDCGHGPAGHASEDGVLAVRSRRLRPRGLRRRRHAGGR